MLSIINAALAAQGLDEVTSLEDGSPEFRILSRHWSLVVEAALETGRFPFARQEVFTQSRVEGKFGFADGYAFPETALHIRDVWTTAGSRIINHIWVQDGSHVYLDEPGGVWMEYATAPDPSFWGANFSQGVQLRLQAVIARATQTGDARELDAQAEMAFDRANTAAAKGRSDEIRPRQSSFALARFGRG
jgi:hypothetical protein